MASVLQVILLCLCSWTRVTSCFFSWWTLYWRWVQSSCTAVFWAANKTMLMSLMFFPCQDLQSTNLIEVCMALTVVSQIFPKDMIPAILPLVEEKLNHPKYDMPLLIYYVKQKLTHQFQLNFYFWHISREIIRRKAVLALYKFYLIAPNQVQHIHNKFRKALCDKDPGVMTASLHIYLNMIQVISTVVFCKFYLEKIALPSMWAFFHVICGRRTQKVTRTWQPVLSPYWSKWLEESCPWISTITMFLLHGCRSSSWEYCLCLARMTQGNHPCYCL